MNNDDVNIRKRCPNGTRRNKKTNICEPMHNNSQKNLKTEIKQIKRCPNGTRKNKKTGLCERTKHTSLTKKSTPSKKQTKLDMYYPSTHIRKIYTRKPKATSKIQTKMTKYLKPTRETTPDKTASSIIRKRSALKKKIAAKKISQFMVQPEVQEKRRTEFLKSICSDSNVCIAFGTEDKKIQDFFNGFDNFQYVVSPIKRIGLVSANGFINEITYKRNDYIAYSVLKSSVHTNADNLMYEYIVGKFLNKMAVYYPCFIKTYGIYQYINNYPHTFMQNNKTINDIYIINNILKTGMKNLQIHDPPNTTELQTGCKNSTYISILTQHVKNAMPIEMFNDIRAYFLLFQVYFTLYCMRDNYTHYDLHGGNVLCYKPDENKYIHFMYHLKNGKVIEFYCNYLAYIIDYGRSFFYENANHNSKTIHKQICKVKCPSSCGEDEGFGILNGTLKHYKINSLINNCSADLRLLHILKEDKIIKLNEKILFTHKYGTPEKKKSGLHENPRTINNVTDAFKVLTEKVEVLNSQMMNAMTSKYTKIGTLHIYENGTTPVHFEKS